MQPWQARHIETRGVEPYGDWRLRHWTICLDGSLDAARFEAGLALGLAALPTPATTASRPGLGFVIRHQGQADYVVIAWWDRENELPMRVFVRDTRGWRASRGSESVCVWDLEVIAAERATYIETILIPDGPDLARWAKPPSLTGS